MKHLMSLVGRLLYRIMGWRFEPVPPYFGVKHVIIGFPHTSNMDTVRAFVGFRIVKKTGHIMIKQEWFVWPFSIFLRSIGGVPVRRGSAQGVVLQMVRAFRDRPEFLLAIVPEGTRKGVRTIKTGFWHIARAARVSIICWYLDNQNRTARWLGEVVPSEDMAADLLRIQQMYADAGYLFPLELGDGDTAELAGRATARPAS